MRTVRLAATLLFYISRAGALLFLTVTAYALAVTAWSGGKTSTLMDIAGGQFTIYYPFTKKAFLLGDYTVSFLFTYLFTVAFYAVFLWLLGDVFRAFRQQRLFTRKAVVRLSRFYLTNLGMPLLFLLPMLVFQSEMNDLIRIMLLHLVIGVFAWFMAAIFRQGVVLQDEQDLTF